jgi:acyl-coenzyme A thioesterase PaaI-like protein
MSEALQEKFSPQGICFGCGPANDKGLRIRSLVEGDEVVADWTPEAHHQAWPGMLNGGITGALLDCHSNWAAAWHLMQRDGLDRPPCTVTAEFHVKLRRPTAIAPLRLRARVTESSGSRATIEATLESGGQVTATCRGVFVAVKEDHPAYHRW